MQGYCTQRIRENTRKYAGYAANKQANIRQYAKNTQDRYAHKDTRRILKNLEYATDILDVSIRRVFAYGFGYISHHTFASRHTSKVGETAVPRLEL